MCSSIIRIQRSGYVSLLDFKISQVKGVVRHPCVEFEVDFSDLQDTDPYLIQKIMEGNAQAFPTHPWSTSGSYWRLHTTHERDSVAAQRSENWSHWRRRNHAATRPAVDIARALLPRSDSERPACALQYFISKDPDTYPCLISRPVK